MKENTKYQAYRFMGKVIVDKIEPWFDFSTAKPWDEGEIPWVLDNKVRREILILLSKSPKTFDEIYSQLNFTPKPLLISDVEYRCKIHYQWSKDTLTNHLLNLEWYHLIHKIDDEYSLTFPILSIENQQELENFIVSFSENWIKIIKQTKNEITNRFGEMGDETPLYEILIEKSVEKLYLLLKKENLLPNQPNIKGTWAEQLRAINFKEWVEMNF